MLNSLVHSDVPTLKESNVDTLKDTISTPEFNRQDSLHALPDIMVHDSLSQKPSSFIKIKDEELLNTVGTANDLNRILVSFPGVASLGTVNDNSLAVRGGVSQENSYSIDGIEVTTVNHFYTLDRTGGAVGFINTDLVQHVDLYTKYIPVSMPPKNSSAIDIILKNVTLPKPVYQCDLNISGLSLLGMGASKNTTFSYLVNGRWNDLRFLEKFITIGGIPSFGDGVIKLCYNISENNAVTTIGLISYDFLKATPFWGDNSENKVHKKELVQSAVGLSSIIKNKILHNHAVLSFHSIHDNYFEKEADAFIFFKNNDINFFGDNRRRTWGFANSLNFRLPSQNMITLGFNSQYKHYYTRHRQWFYDHDTTVNAIRVSGFAEGIVTADFYTVRFGVRGDYYTLITDYGISPRVECSIPIHEGGLISVNAASSYQIPVDIEKKLWTFLIGPDNIPYRIRDLRLQRCNQLGIGYENHIGNVLRINIDTYAKLYDREYALITPWKKDYINYEQTLDGVKQYCLKHPRGEKRTFGMEVSLQEEKYSLIDYSVNVTLSLVENKYNNGKWYRDGHDIPVSFKSQFGIFMGKSHLFALGASYSTGRPLYDVLNNPGGYVSDRFKPTFLLNFRYSFNRQFTKITFSTYIELMNIINQRHVLYRDEDMDYKLNGFLPIGGITIEF